MESKFWNKEEENFLIGNFNSYSYSEVGRVLNRSQKSIESKAKQLNLKKNKRVCRVPYLNNQAFYEINNDMAYLLGVIFTDGNIACCKHQYIIRLTVHEKQFRDIFVNSLEKWMGKRIFSWEGICLSGFSKGRYQYHASISSKYHYLILKHLLDNFSKLKQSLISSNQVPAFLSGVFDGDGCFSWGIRANKQYHYQLNYKSIKKEKLSLIEDLLEYLGIKSHQYKEVLIIYRRNAILDFSNKIGFRILRKQKNLELWKK